MTDDIRIVLPAVDGGFFSNDLYELSRILGQRNPDLQAHGILGGEWGYGQEFRNDVFEMWPFYWGDCDCGFEDEEAVWDEGHDERDSGYMKEWTAWSKTHDHKPTCSTARPNFRYFASGLEVRWYKYIGRSMEVNQEISARNWSTIFIECVDSIWGDKGVVTDGDG